jgi:TolB protein
MRSSTSARVDVRARVYRTVGAAALLLTIASSCTSEPERRDLPDVDVGIPADPTTATSAAAPTVASDVAGLTGRLAVLDADGHLVTMNPDGSDEIILDEVAPGTSQVRQPTWSPDGRRVAWVHVEVTEAGAVSASIATAGDDGTRPSMSRTEVVPFYLSWDPTSSRIAYLGAPSDTFIELGVLELADRSSGKSLDAGQPVFFSWGPDGDQLLVHIGAERLDRLGLDGSTSAVGDRPGTFSVPVWTADGKTLVYASADGDGQRLVARNVKAESGRPLVPYEGLIAFVVSPDGERVAFQVLEPGRIRPLSVIDVGSGQVVEIVDAPIASFFWSPDAERLLYLEPDPLPDDTGLWFRWGVWDGTSSFVTPRIALSQLISVEYLQFFEQYAQSMRLWSPDSRAFAYPGTSEDGREGIWIQSARPDRAPILVAEGDFVAWSPT